MPPARLTLSSTLALPLRPHLPTPSVLPLTHQTRPASHASQGRANKAANGPGKRLGLKRPASSLVVPGNIIFRQRGTHWYPGENCGMGRDHTIFAKEKGYVVFYKDERVHKRRKFIGVVFERGEGLPRAEGTERRRRLGLVSRGRMDGTVDGGLDIAGREAEDVGNGEEQVEVRQQSVGQRKKVPDLELRPGYQYRESNWHIGRAAERAGIKVREYKRGDRFLAWRKLNARKARNAERRAMGSRKKKGNAKRK